MPALNQVPTEKAVSERDKKLLKSRGAVFYKQHGSTYSVKGCPDFLCVYRGWFIAVETKRNHSSSKTTEDQDKQLERIAAAGGLAVVSRGNGLLAQVLNNIDRGAYTQGGVHVVMREGVTA